MRHIITPFFIVCFLSCSGQDEFSAFTDFHIHPTYKHYYRYPKGDIIAKILETSRRDCDTVYIDTDTQKSYSGNKYDNWYNYNIKHKGKRDLSKGRISHLHNYDQASYAQLMYTPGSILCASYYPFEKQFAQTLTKRLGNSWLVTKMTLKRLKYYKSDKYIPMHDFLAEYYYTLMQQPVSFVKPSIPDALYKNGQPKTYHTGKGYYNQMVLVKNNEELQKLVSHNQQYFAGGSKKDSFWFYTPMVLTIEGGQVLYGDSSGSNEHILDPWLYDSDNDSLRPLVRKELLDNTCFLKNLPHHLFFITLGHFAQNSVVGFSKTLDRDPENVQHRLPQLLSKSTGIRQSLINKYYDGFNIIEYNDENGRVGYDSIGYDVVKAFLDTANRFHKPTYIDVKHMDVKARIQYYYLRRQLEQEKKMQIPIVASHFAVSGENQTLAAATGLWPIFDRYEESEDPLLFYKKEIWLSNGERRDSFWRHVMVAGDYYSNNPPPLDSFERQMYRPLAFLNPSSYTAKEYDPFKKYDSLRIVDSRKEKFYGWYYPWSINLFDEEMIEISKSNGIIGLLLDPRQLGGYLANYEEHKKQTMLSYQQILDTIPEAELQTFGLSKKDLNPWEYLKSEPLLRNIFYIARVLKMEAFLEVDANRNQYPQLASLYYTPDSAKMKKDAWHLLSIGSDYDGLIDPIDYAPTASYLPILRKKLIAYARIFALLHRDDFALPFDAEPFITSFGDAHDKLQRIFYENGKEFILQYF